jgi:glycosyltransferase involved in cell wall biosynthesis
MNLYAWRKQKRASSRSSDSKRMLSFIIPAHNEERYVGDCIASVTTSARVLRQSFEVIVVDDASTDRTLAIAATHGAKVVKVAHRQDRGYAQRRCARGEWLFFVDADTLANPRALRACLQALEGGAVGGGCVFTFDGTLPRLGEIAIPRRRRVGAYVQVDGRLLLVLGDSPFQDRRLLPRAAGCACIPAGAF